ncbi:polysaccharide deacetylase family protein [Paenibacillus sedimenti]|uniref:Polysaccharide deacetylase family protein n=1 Tax=Paenibacillus sedimenti TaxID=2770274 RepID=A0A926KN82_9BACL|nr:polysaccharide deacetylase family protein [Paenibacillus sedimenti]MBD0380407.1 polysaccharide deacetylase family protein [Paenibacillus sedimenti]
MIKWLWFFAIVCILVSGCGISQKKPDHDRRYTQDSDGHELELKNEQKAASSNLENGPRSDNTPSTTSILESKPASPEPSASPADQPEPTPTSATPVPSPIRKGNARKAMPQPEAAKKPAVPVQQVQGQKQSSGRKLTLSQLVVKYPDTFKLRGSSQEKKVALTFDDGPDTRFTPKVLDALKANQVKATFFLLGAKASAHPDIVKRIVREGHVIGNHTYSHANLPGLTVDKFQKQIESAENVLQSMIGYAPKLIRPPYGAINEEQVKWVADHHYLIVNWNVDSLDWKSLKSEQVLQNIMQQAKPGSIILQHSGGADSQDLSGTVLAISPLVSKLKAAGYTFVTVPELLHVTKSK